ncbi:C4orf29 -like, partial [Asbolus verrucosus]
LFNFRKVVSDRTSCYDLVPKDYPIEIINAQIRSGCQIIEGRFWTPFRLYLPTLLVPEIQQVFFQMVVPQKWPTADYRPMCIHLAGTGDHGVMSESIDWDMLQKQFFSNALYCDTLSKSCKIVDSPFACTLSRIPEYGFNTLLEEQSNRSYVSPYEIMNILNATSCPAITYKRSSHNIKVESDEYSTLNLSIFKTSEEVLNMRKRDKEAVWFMRGMMDEFTHLKNFSVPFDPSLIIAVCAKSDGYVPRVGISNLDEIWAGATVKYVDTGHVGAYIWHRKLFRDCIIEAFEKAKKVVPPPGPYFEV